MTYLRTITMQEAQSNLTEIINGLSPGEEIVITRDDKAVAALRAVAPAVSQTPRQLGTLRGSVLYMAADFDAIPEGFEDGEQPD